MSPPLQAPDCKYVTEECLREWKGQSAAAFRLPDPVPMSRFLYELCWAVVSSLPSSYYRVIRFLLGARFFCSLADCVGLGCAGARGPAAAEVPGGAGFGGVRGGGVAGGVRLRARRHRRPPRAGCECS